jgi:sugar lactone lactonase YvrE
LIETVSKPLPLTADALEPIGSGLHRPECVVVDDRDAVYVPDWRGGVTRLGVDGTQQTWLAVRSPVEVRPNGIALMPDGSFLLANLSDAGGVWHLDRSGRITPFLTEVNGVPLPPANFVVRDGARVWISISTRLRPRQQAWRPDVADGFIVLVDDLGARVVADRLHYTNEVRPDPSGTWLYVVETFGRRLTRFRIGASGALSAHEVVASLGRGHFPDGVAFDRAGRIWITSLISNRLSQVHAEGIETVLADEHPGFVAEVEAAFEAGVMQPEHLGPIPGTRLQHVTSVAFGSDPTVAYLGTLHGRCVYRARIDAWRDSPSLIRPRGGNARGA